MCEAALAESLSVIAEEEVSSGEDHTSAASNAFGPVNEESSNEGSFFSLGFNDGHDSRAAEEESVDSDESFACQYEGEEDEEEEEDYLGIDLFSFDDDSSEKGIKREQCPD